ncbi:hypothetical protein SGUI_1287 [Serinicoccus hydrothermalis]|uniref:Uncharacterized protein n=1 Tax=Serinicoccus hydrothermalis TaxID=1758689 RepID=A0A1B1NB81_9MICO|nr:hypothetical protein SGUI_1287 [Serinicoccus hydrothermalis]
MGGDDAHERISSLGAGGMVSVAAATPQRGPDLGGLAAATEEEQVRHRPEL